MQLLHSSHWIAFDLTVDEQRRRVLRAIGDVDLQTAPDLSRHIAMTTEPGETLVIDLRQVRFMDGPGLGTLIACDQRQRDHGGCLVLKDLPTSVRELVDVVRLADVIEIE